MKNKMYRILLVEDDEIIADSLKRHLERWDYEVICVNDFANIMTEYAFFPLTTRSEYSLNFFLCV